MNICQLSIKHNLEQKINSCPKRQLLPGLFNTSKALNCHSTMFLHSFLHPKSNVWPAVNLIKTCWVVACVGVWLRFLFQTRTLFNVYFADSMIYSCNTYKSRLSYQTFQWPLFSLKLKQRLIPDTVQAPTNILQTSWWLNSLHSSLINQFLMPSVSPSATKAILQKTDWWWPNLLNSSKSRHPATHLRTVYAP